MSTYNSIFQTFHNVREMVVPALSSSKFAENGVLTPEEFVAAGDQLVYKCPTWSWQPAEPGKKRSYLPDDKQFLITRHVPCRQRVEEAEGAHTQETEVDGELEGDVDGWLATSKPKSLGTSGSGEEGDGFETVGDDFEEILDDVSKAVASIDVKAPAVMKSQDDDDDDFLDVDDYEEAELEEAEDDEASLGPQKVASSSSHIVKTRSYDLSISYDKYYQVPRVWLFGYDESGAPLNQEQTYEDVMQDYADRTVTMEAHPHLSGSYASIHPCMHAVTMKHIISNLVLGGVDPRPDQYLFIFLKFIQSVIPTIDYDFTMSIEFGKK